MKKFAAVFTVFALAFCLMSGTAFAAATIRIGHSDTTSNLIHVSLLHFAEAVKERSGGEITVEVFAAEQLGSNAEMSEMIEMGNLDAMMMPSGQESNYAPKMLVLSLPFLFSDYDHVYKVLDGPIGDSIIADLASRNMVQVAWWENGLRQITNNVRPLEKPEDLQGLKIRTPEDDLTLAIFRAYGASPAPMAFSELYLALQQGTFDGQENPVANIFANNFQDVQKYITMVNYQYQPKNMIFNAARWNSFSDEQKKLLSDAAKEFGAEHRKAIRDNEESMLAKLKEAGMEVGYPDTKPFIDAAQSVYADFYKQHDWAEQLVNEINALR